MKKTLLLLLLLSITVSFAQKKIKVKGNKEIIETSYPLENFNKIEANFDYEITYSMNNSKNSYSLKSDSNIQDKITFKVIDSTLMIYSDYSISPTKKMKIVLNTIQFNSLKLKGKTHFIQEGFANVDENLTIEMNDNTFLKIDVKTKDLNLKMNQKSDCSFIIQSENISINLDEKVTVEGKINASTTDLKMYKNTEAILEGSTNDLKATLVGKTSLKAKKLFTNTVVLNQSLSSDAYLNVSKKISLYLSDDSKLYLFNSPEVIVNGIRDFAQIIKKKL